MKHRASVKFDDPSVMQKLQEGLIGKFRFISGNSTNPKSGDRVEFVTRSGEVYSGTIVGQHGLH